MLVTVVPMFAPITIGTAFSRGSGFSGAATRPTTIDVVTDELCTSVVASSPTISAAKGFEVALKNESSKSPPSSVKPSPKPRTPIRKTNNRAATAAARAKFPVASTPAVPDRWTGSELIGVSRY